MKLYNANLSPNAWRVRAVASELGIDLEIVDVDLRNGGQKTPEFLAMNPNGKVPVLADGDFVLWESRAIDTYLASQKPERGLYSDDPRTRAVIDQWVYWQAAHLGTTVQKIVFEKFMKGLFGMGEADPSVVAAETKALEQLLAILEGALKGKDWIAGPLTIADFTLASTFIYRKPAGISLDAYPNISRWLAAMEARESWKTASAPILKMLG
ncbi:MAG: glutathione S-transferase family protein [Oricola sp.]